MEGIVNQQLLIEGVGLDEQSAKIDAYKKLKAQFKDNVLVLGMLSCIPKEPVSLGTQCTTKNFKPDGARKWTTTHEVYLQNPNNHDEWKKVNSFDNKTDAVKFAKEFSLKYQSNTEVRLCKLLPTTEDHVEAAISPKNAKCGTWEITLNIIAKSEDVAKIAG